MNESLLVGLRNYLVRVPRFFWQRQVARGAATDRARIGFMSAEHHLVRNFAVLELPRRARAITQEEIARELNIPYQRVGEIVDSLEKAMTFLFRNDGGDIAWAYPVTVDPTPHRVRFSTGEHIQAA